MPTGTAICQASTECRTHTGKRNRIWEEDKRKVAFGRINWEEMLTQPKFAKKAAQFMKSLGLIDQFKSVTLDDKLVSR